MLCNVIGEMYRLSVFYKAYHRCGVNLIGERYRLSVKCIAYRLPLAQVLSVLFNACRRFVKLIGVAYVTTMIPVLVFCEVRKDLGAVGACSWLHQKKCLVV